MKIKVLLVIAAVSMAAIISACSGSMSTGNSANTTNSNAAKPANTTAANTTAANTTDSNSSAPAGDIVKLDEGGILMTVPKGFTSTKQGADVVVSTADDGVAVRFTVPEDGDYEKAVSDAADNLDKYIKDVKVESKAKKDTINGMDAMTSSGTGKDKDGKKVNWELTVLKTDKKPVLVIIYAEEASIAKHAADLESFLNSVKKQ
jgi:PBP1b-binding outer membrane lipoprotein LpoB